MMNANFLKKKVKITISKLIHKFKMLGNNIVIDINSGNVHVVDDLVFDILDHISYHDLDCMCPEKLELIYKNLKDYNKNDVDNALNELRFLYSNGKIFTADKIYEYFKTTNSSSSKLKSMCLSIAHDCNFRCTYCFAENGSYGMPERALMNEKTACNAIDFFVENSGGNSKILELDFFGGEPLLNYEVVKKTVEYARNLEKKIKKMFRFTITTNASNLDDDKIEFLNNEMHNVVLSLDGRKCVNDKFRKTISGKPTFELVAEKIYNFVKLRRDKKYCIRGTFTSNNLDFSEDVFFLYEKLGAKNISLEPVICDENLPYAIKKSDLEKVFQEPHLLLMLMPPRTAPPFTLALVLLITMVGCGAHWGWACWPEYWGCWGCAY